MRRHFVVSLFFLIFFCFGQTYGQITYPCLFTVQDSLGRPVQQANLEIFYKAKSILLRSTNIKGEVKADLSLGTYKLTITSIGYLSVTDSVRVQKNTNTFNYILKESRTQLMGITITSLKAFISNKPGKTILNVRNSPFSTLPSVWDILKLSPNVKVSGTDQITVSNQGTVVYLNDRLLNLDTDNLKAYLENLAGETIDKIEIVRAPGSASMGEAPTSIRIYTKKITKDGFRTSLRAALSQNTFTQYLYGANIDIKQGKFNLQSSINFNKARKRLTGDLETNTGINQVSKFNNIADQTKDILNWNNELSYQANRHVQIFSVLNLLNNNGQTNDSSVSTYGPSARSIGIINSKSATPAINLGVNIQLDTTAKIIFQADHYYNHADLKNNYVISGLNSHASNPTTETVNRTSPVYMANINYTKEASTFVFESGLRYSNVDLKNNNQSYSTETVGSNYLNYNFKEHIYSGFINSDFKFKRLALSLGLRAERTSANADFVSLQGTYPINTVYNSFFPSMLIQYTSKENNAISVSYKRNITRPDYYLLNPFKRYIGNISTFEGDVNTRPQYTQTIETSLTINSGLNFNVGIQFIKDFISTYIVQNADSSGVTERYQNFDNTRIYYLTGSYAKAWNEKLNTLINGNLFYVEASLSGVNSGTPTPAISFSVINQFKISPTWVNTLSYSNNSGYSDGFFKHQNNGSLDYNFQKAVPKLNLTLQLGINDILRTDKQGNYALYNFTYRSNEYADSRKIRFAIIYRMGNNKIKTVKIDNKSDSDIRNRLEKP